jgi:hypothetical protein
MPSRRTSSPKTSDEKCRSMLLHRAMAETNYCKEERERDKRDKRGFVTAHPYA